MKYGLVCIFILPLVVLLVCENFHLPQLFDVTVIEEHWRGLFLLLVVSRVSDNPHRKMSTEMNEFMSCLCEINLMYIIQIIIHS